MRECRCRGFEGKASASSRRQEGEAEIGMVEPRAPQQAAQPDRNLSILPFDRVQTEAVLGIHRPWPGLDIPARIIEVAVLSDVNAERTQAIQELTERAEVLA